MSRLWFVWALGMGGCLDTRFEDSAAPMRRFDLTPNSPTQRVVLNVELEDPGLPRRARLNRNQVELFLSAQHFVDSCPPNQECPHQITVDAEGYSSSGDLSLEHGGMAQGGGIVGGLFEDCLPLQACTRSFAFDLELIGDDFVAVEAYATANYEIVRRSTPDLGRLWISIGLEPVPD
ncbi:MAG: hypothetical protein AB8H79_12545 [Myxococcota bacterium]